MFNELIDLKGKSAEDAVRIIESHLRANQQELEYILTHLDSSNILEINTKKTKIYEGEDD